MMRSRYLPFVLAPVFAAAACQNPMEPGRSQSGAGQAAPGAAAAPAGTTGGGHYLVGALDVTFAFTAMDTPGGISGRFHHSVLLGGELVEFHGLVTCVTVDATNRRAWIGGIITQNRSEATSFRTERHEPGKDVWFRVLDSGEGTGAEPDRTTFLGFEGDAGFDTSADYCAGQPWPDNNERTNAVISGNIQVRP